MKYILTVVDHAFVDHTQFDDAHAAVKAMLDLAAEKKFEHVPTRETIVRFLETNVLWIRAFFSKKNASHQIILAKLPVQS